jgi:hypothetical protein
LNKQRREFFTAGDSGKASLMQNRWPGRGAADVGRISLVGCLMNGILLPALSGMMQNCARDEKVFAEGRSRKF